MSDREETAKKPRIIKVASVSEAVAKEGRKPSAEEMLATLCFYYPQYTYAMAQRLPYKRVRLLIDTARRIEARRFYNLTNIVAAPHTHKGEGVKALSKHFKELMGE